MAGGDEPFQTETVKSRIEKIKKLAHTRVIAVTKDGFSLKMLSVMY
jgi:hypothetical protein